MAARLAIPSFCEGSPEFKCESVVRDLCVEWPGWARPLYVSWFARLSPSLYSLTDATVFSTGICWKLL